MTIAVYPWKEALWDIAIEHFGLDPDFVEYVDICETQNKLPSGLDAAIFSAFVNGELKPLDSNGLLLQGMPVDFLLSKAHVAELAFNQWLGHAGYPFRWTPGIGNRRRAQAQLKQEEVILSTITSLGLDPKKIRKPQKAAGTKFEQGDKARIRALARRNSPDLVHSDEVFDKAWERLRKHGRIRSA
jgi:hypothetical protein